jgi:hypothetical protein
MKRAGGGRYDKVGFVEEGNKLWERKFSHHIQYSRAMPGKVLFGNEKSFRGSACNRNYISG